MQFSIQNLGLTVPTQTKAQGFNTSVGTSMGFGERHDPIDGQSLRNPGVGEYNLAKDALENHNPGWR